MGNKRQKKGDQLAVVGRSVSALINAEDATEAEILNTPVLSARADDDNDGDDDEDDEDEEDEEAEIERRLVEEMQAEKAKMQVNAIYNKDAMLALANELDLSTKFKWVETLDTSKFPLELENAHDDLKREVAFYNQTLASVKHAKDRLLKEKIPYKRPDDYFAEMLKSDAHMARVKDKLIFEQKKINAVEERKKSQAHKKVAKELQSQKAKERLKEKNDTLEAVKQWKKRKNTNNSSAGGKDDDENFEKVLESTNKRKRDGGDEGKNKKPRNFKREAANKKFGSGGKTKLTQKRNDRKSTNDFSSFSRSRNNEGVGKRSNKKQAGKRPGKAARSKSMQKRGRK
ncbi:putative rRNA-processing protein EBP2 [Aphanomyces cochlioides]|nr:putative rRNA-processing protein EBP2 [Aphanomyces cochlioides]